MKKNRLILMLLMLLQLQVVFAAYVENLAVDVKQPDGEQLHIFATGDEYHNWLHDENGYTIIQDKNTGYYHYAINTSEGDVVPSIYRVGKVNPATVGITKGVNLSKTLLDQKVNQLKEEKAAATPANASGKTSKLSAPGHGGFEEGFLNQIVVFIKFAGDTDFTLTSEEIDSRFNSTGQKSVKDFFATMSGGAMDVSTYYYPEQTGTYPITYVDQHPRSYYQTGTPDGYGDDGTERRIREHELLKNAMESIAAQIPSTIDFDGNDDGRFDNIVFIVKGGTDGWSNLLWPHRWALYTHNVEINGLRVYDYNFLTDNAIKVGVISHELFHTFGAPDLYRYTSEVITTPTGGWDLMSNGNWDTPQHTNVYYKKKFVDWGPEIQEITAPGTYTLEAISSNPFAAYKIPIPNSTTEFLMVEYRKKVGFYESILPGEGLIIYRINTLRNGNASGDNEVYIYRPDGTPDVNGNIYQAAFSSTNNRTQFDDNTNPAAWLRGGGFAGLPAGLGISNVTALGSNTISFDFGTTSGFTITASAGLGGAISPSGATAVQAGNDLTYTMTPNAGYEVTDVIVDGASQGPLSSYTFTNVSASHTISATFTVAIGCTANEWDANATYVANDVVSYNNHEWKAKWWNQNEVPGSNQYGAWEDLGECAADIDPTVQITSPINFQEYYLRPSENPTIDITVDVNDEETNIDSVQYIIVEVLCNGPGCANVSRFTVTDAPYTLSYSPDFRSTYTQINAVAFSNGIGSTQSSVEIDVNALPEIEILYPADEQNVIVDAANPEMTVYVDVNDEFVAIDSVEYIVVEIKAAGPATQYSERRFVSYEAPYSLTFAPKLGRTFTRIVAIPFGDEGKTAGSKSVQCYVRTQPTVTITSPADGQHFYLKDSENPTVDVTVDLNYDETEIDSVRYIVVDILCNGPGCANVRYITETQYPFTLELDPMYGTYTEVHAVPFSGGVGANGDEFVTLYFTALPEIEITSPTEGDTVWVNPLSPQVTVTADANDELTTIDSVEFVVIEVLAAGPGTQYSERHFFDYSAPYEVTFDAQTDRTTTRVFSVVYSTIEGSVAGSNDFVEFVVRPIENELPTVAFTSPAEGDDLTYNPSNPAAINVTVDANDVDGHVIGVSYHVTDGYGSFNYNTSAAPFTMDYTPRVAGLVTVEARATDDNGAMSVIETLTFTVTESIGCSSPVWVSTTAYNSGDIVSLNGTEYQANWWTQGQNPENNSGVVGSGQPWTILGACSGNAATATVRTLPVYPNPASHTITLEVPESGDLIITNSLNIPVVAQQVSNGQVTIDISDLLPGAYILNLTTDSAQYQTSFLKR